MIIYRNIISSSYPYVYEHEKISECMEILTDYEEDSIPVLTQDKENRRNLNIFRYCRIGR